MTTPESGVIVVPTSAHPASTPRPEVDISTVAMILQEQQ